MTKKTIITLSIILISIVFVIGIVYYQFNKGGNTPEDAASQFLFNLSHGNDELARNYLSTETGKLYNDERMEEFRNVFFSNKETSIDARSITLGKGGEFAIGSLMTVRGENGIFQSPISFEKTIFGWKIANIKLLEN